MIGYLINFFKYTAIDTDDFENEDKLYLNDHNGEKFVRSVVWSVFDRIEIRKIDKFDEFRLSQYSEKKWIGERQFILLYEINSQEGRLSYQESKDKCLFSFHKTYTNDISGNEKKKKEEKYRFYGISMIDLAPEVHYDFYKDENPGKKMYTVMCEFIDNLCEENGVKNEKLCYELYGTLGGNDLVIIWLANEFKDVVIILEALRMSKIKNSNKSIIANVATIMGLRDINNKNIKYEDVEGDLNIRFTKKGTYEHNEFIKALCEALDYDETIDTTLGEHDLLLRIPGIKLTKGIYNDSGFIHIRNKDFLENIIQANTELSVKIDYASLKGKEYKLVNKINRTVISLDEKEEVYRDIEEIVNDIFFDKLLYLKETLWILYEDYLRNISSSFSYPWVSDLHYQFSASIKYLKELIKEESILSKNIKYECLKELIGTLRQTILHVSQANRIFFEVPNTHLKNTGSYSKILRTYYGIVKQLLIQAYCIPKYEEQAAIVPFITFDVIPKIISTRLPKLSGCDFVIINIVLPYEALVDIPKYSKLLAHEVFHYITPVDREERNTEIGIVYVALFISQKLMEYIYEIIGCILDEESCKIILKSYNEKVNEKCLRYVIDNFEKLMLYVTDYNSNYEWTSYFNKLERVFGSGNVEFYKLEELHYDIFDIFKEIVNVPIKEIVLLKMGEDELEKVEEIFHEETKENFISWLTKKGSINKLSIIKAVKYALREIIPDYFMIQVMDRREWEKNYYTLILYYKELLTNKEDEIDMRQMFRIGIMTDYLFSDITNDFGKEDTNRILNKLKNKLKEKTGISDEMQEYVIECFFNYYEALKQYRGLIFLYIKNMDFNNFSSTNFKNALKKTKRLLNSSDIDEFQKNIQYVEHFQVQNELINLLRHIVYISKKKGDSISVIREKLGIDLLRPVTKYIEVLSANDINSLIRKLDNAAKEISDDSEPIWYRGHKSNEYKLIPSLYRMKDEKRCFYREISLRDMMEPLFKSFKVRSFGAKEIYEKGDDTCIGTLVSMQHYSVPTNILDWSTSAFNALYFVVEDYMSLSEKEKAVRVMPKDDAEIWLLNPIRMNVARGYLTSRRNENGAMGEYPIPSIYENDDEFNEYIPFSKQINPSKVPVAVYVPHVNQRIKAQLGTFTMFSLDIKGIATEDGKSVRFESLVEMQENYKKMIELDYKNGFVKEDYKPFLNSVRISKKCLLEVADWLKRMGISKPNMYPELTNISQALTGEIRDYWEKKQKNILNKK